ncbi:MAG: hypothetical protein ACR2MM_09975 [Flavobacteriaceae bacterium]
MKKIIYAVFTIVIASWTSDRALAQEYSEAALGYDPGEFELVQSPYPEDLRPLFIPRFRGIIRLGTPNSYGLSANPIPQDVYRSQKERSDLLNKKKQSILRVFELMEIHYRNSELDLDDLASEFRPTILKNAPLDDPKRTTLYWSGLLKEKTPRFLTPKTLSKYWCKEGENCIPSGTRNGTYVSPKKNRPTWGGAGSDEFARLRAWQAYVKTEVPKMQKWASQINVKEAYIVGTTYIRDYDFNHEGFIIRVDAVQPKALKSSLLSYRLISDKESLFARSQVNGNFLIGKLIKMSPEKAEKLVETMEAHNPRNREVYYVYKASIGFGTPDGPQGAYGSAPTQLFQEPASPIVEFFLDEQLKQKLFEADFSK